MLDFVIITKGLMEFIGLLLVGQFLVYVMSFGRHATNPVYKGICFLTSPVVKLVRFVTPKFVVDRHVPLVSFLIAFWAWAVLVVLKAQMTLGAA